MTIVSLQVSESPVQVACEALGRMPNWQAAVQHLKSLTSRLQEIQCPRLLGRWIPVFEKFCSLLLTNPYDSFVQDQGNTRRAAAEAICRLTFLASNEASWQTIDMDFFDIVFPCFCLQLNDIPRFARILASEYTDFLDFAGDECLPRSSWSPGLVLARLWGAQCSFFCWDDCRTVSWDSVEIYGFIWLYFVYTSNILQISIPKSMEPYRMSFRRSVRGTLVFDQGHDIVTASFGSNRWWKIIFQSAHHG